MQRITLMAHQPRQRRGKAAAQPAHREHDRVQSHRRPDPAVQVGFSRVLHAHQPGRRPHHLDARHHLLPRALDRPVRQPGSRGSTSRSASSSASSSGPSPSTRSIASYSTTIPKSERVAKIWFMFHGVHHAQPQLKTRLVMPPVLSIPRAIVFYFLFYFLIGKADRRAAVGRPDVCRLHDRLPGLRHDALCHAPLADALGRRQVPEALPHDAPFQDAVRRAMASARRCGMSSSGPSLEATDLRH